jgi:hypothetical protein
MKDYKGRGSDLQFREAKPRPVARLLAIAVGLAVLAVAGLYMASLLMHETDPSDEAAASTTIGAIPLSLPPAQTTQQGRGNSASQIDDEGE